MRPIPSVTSSPRSVDQKLAAIQAAGTRVKKNGYNAFHKYNYASEADVVDHVREILTQHNCAVTTGVVPGTLQVQHSDKKTMCWAEMFATLIDGHTSETITTTVASYSESNDDKAVFKMLTGGKKYALMLLFNIATGDDPERDEKPAPLKRTAPLAPPPTALEETIEKLRKQTFAIARKIGFTDTQRHEFITAQFGQRSILELDEAQLRVYGRHLKSLQDAMEPGA